MRNPIPDGMARRVADILRSVPHVSGTTHYRVPGIGPAVTLVILVDGWGPTLHASSYEVAWTYNDERLMLADIVDQAECVAAQQRQLADIAAGFGIGRPLFRDAPDPLRDLVPADADLVSNMHVERVLADAIVAALGANGAADKIVRCVDTLLKAEQHEALRLRLSAESIEARDGRIVIQPSHLIGGPAHASVIGHVLDLRARIPETVLTAAVGRPLGSLVRTGVASLDAAEVVRTETYGFDGLQVETPSDPVRIGDHPGLAKGLAATCRSGRGPSASPSPSEGERR